MQLTLSSVVLVTLGLFSVASAQEKYPFPLRAWRNTRFTPDVLQVSHYVEIDSRGDAVINKTAGYPGFQSYLWPTPEEGTLHTIDDKLQGYLFPVPGVTTEPPSPNAKHYQLKYSEGIPEIAGVLYTNFTTFGRGCGGNCGGSTLDYDDGGEPVAGDWYIVKEKSKNTCGAGGHVWKVRWVSSPSFQDPIYYPKDAIPVYLWKN